MKSEQPEKTTEKLANIFNSERRDKPKERISNGSSAQSGAGTSTGLFEMNLATLLPYNFSVCLKRVQVKLAIRQTKTPESHLSSADSRFIQRVGQGCFQSQQPLWIATDSERASYFPVAGFGWEITVPGRREDVGPFCPPRSGLAGGVMAGDGVTRTGLPFCGTGGAALGLAG